MGTAATQGFDRSAGAGQSYISEMIELTINHVSFGKNADIDAILRGEGEAIEYTATQDGRHYDRRGWCECKGADALFCERWTQAGREFHGWICADCRRLVQAG